LLLQVKRDFLSGAQHRQQIVLCFARALLRSGKVAPLVPFLLATHAEKYRHRQAEVYQNAFHF
jgi:hypothetical protein